MKIEQARVRKHRLHSGQYRLLELECPAIAGQVAAGQFIHLRVPRLEASVLRRPFSIFDSDGEALSILYKDVGAGTVRMTALAPGETLSVMGPLGNGFPRGADGAHPVLVAGGYGVAPLHLLAKQWGRRGDVFIGGAASADVLCVEEFTALGWGVHTTTEDGSEGTRGLVTDALEAWLAQRADAAAPEFFACGPEGLLKAVGGMAVSRGLKAWLSMDKRMGCGAGACLACVQRIRLPDGGETWARVCREGPVFEARDIVW